MNEPDSVDASAALAVIRQQAAVNAVRLTLHAQAEMTARSITLDEVIEAIAGGEVLESYPEHQRGACCLLHGATASGRHLHIVCTIDQPVLIIITVYEPQKPKWISPTERGR